MSYLIILVAFPRPPILNTEEECFLWKWRNFTARWCFL